MKTIDYSVSLPAHFESAYGYPKIEAFTRSRYATIEWSLHIDKVGKTHPAVMDIHSEVVEHRINMYKWHCSKGPVNLAVCDELLKYKKEYPQVDVGIGGTPLAYKLFKCPLPAVEFVVMVLQDAHLKWYKALGYLEGCVKLIDDLFLVCE